MEYMEDASKHEILEAIAGLDQKIDGVKTGLEQKIDGVSISLDQKIVDVVESVQALAEHMDDRFDAVDQRFERIESRMTRTESLMVTKPYLDEKLGDFKGDMVRFVRAEDAKILAKLR